MSDDRERFEKVLAIAINPGAYEEEAIAALRKARELAKKDPSLAHPPPPPPPPAPKPAPPGETSVQFRVTKLPYSWLLNVISNLSGEAFGLGLKSKIVCDFDESPIAIDVRCDGPKGACDAFGAHLTWLIDFINSRASQT